jgi:hypothetical protein
MKSDITIKVSNKEYKLHKILLSLNSNYYKKIFEIGNQYGNEEIFYLEDDFHQESWELFIDLIYKKIKKFDINENFFNLIYKLESIDLLDQFKAIIIEIIELWKSTINLLQKSINIDHVKEYLWLQNNFSNLQEYFTPFLLKYIFVNDDLILNLPSKYLDKLPVYESEPISYCYIQICKNNKLNINDNTILNGYNIYWKYKNIKIINEYIKNI